MAIQVAMCIVQLICILIRVVCMLIFYMEASAVGSQTLLKSVGREKGLEVRVLLLPPGEELVWVQ